MHFSTKYCPCTVPPYIRIVHLLPPPPALHIQAAHHARQATRAAKTRRASSAGRWACVPAPCCCLSVALPWLLLRDPSRLLQQLAYHAMCLYACTLPGGHSRNVVGATPSPSLSNLSAGSRQSSDARVRVTRPQCRCVALIWKEKKWNLPFVIGLASGRYTLDEARALGDLVDAVPCTLRGWRTAKLSFAAPIASAAAGSSERSKLSSPSLPMELTQPRVRVSLSRATETRLVPSGSSRRSTMVTCVPCTHVRGSSTARPLRGQTRARERARGSERE